MTSDVFSFPFWLALFTLFVRPSLTIILPLGRSSLKTLNLTQSEWLKSICGRSTELENGRRYPWVVSIVTHEGKNRLGGTIISPFHILTAAHGFTRFSFITDGDWTMRRDERCQFNGLRRADSRLVAFGDDCIRVHTTYDFQRLFNMEKAFRYRMGKQKYLNTDLDALIKIRNNVCKETSVQFNKINAVYMHDGFLDGGCVRGHDWALIEVEKEMNFTSPAVRPICLPTVPNNLEEKLAYDPGVMIVGWGKPNAFSDGSPRVREIPMLYDAACRAPWSDVMPTNAADYICAKALNVSDDATPRTCHGDSGAGLEVRDGRGRAFLLGVTSFGTKMCPSNELVRFTRVTNYLHQICALTGVCYTT